MIMVEKEHSPASRVITAIESNCATDSGGTHRSVPHHQVLERLEFFKRSRFVLPGMKCGNVPMIKISRLFKKARMSMLKTLYKHVSFLSFR